MALIKNIKNFLGETVYPITKMKAVYDDNGKRLDSLLKEGVSNPNLLINANFANPVNQRGYVSGTTTTVRGYSIDRWILNKAGISLTMQDTGITINPVSASDAQFQQFIEFPETYFGRTLTLSASVDGVIYRGEPLAIPVDTTASVWGSSCKFGNDDYIRIRVYNGSIYCQSYITSDGPLHNSIINWIKIEEGEIATPFRPRTYAEELQLCMRYFQVIGDSSGNNHEFFNIMECTKTSAYFEQSLFVPMRVTPTMEVLENPSYVSGADKAINLHLNLGGTTKALSRHDGTISSVKVAPRSANRVYLQCFFSSQDITNLCGGCIILRPGNYVVCDAEL